MLFSASNHGHAFRVDLRALRTYEEKRQANCLQTKIDRRMDLMSTPENLEGEEEKLLADQFSDNLDDKKGTNTVTGGDSGFQQKH